MSARTFSRYGWVVTGFAVLTILWGSLVRATGSGAGCGGHWPTCNGSLVLLPHTRAMWFELPHRLSSALLILMVAVLAVLSFRAFERGHVVRKLALGAFAVIVLEALLGAGLVLFGLVGNNDSLTRAIVIAIHLANTLLLLGTLTLTAWRSGLSEPVVLVGTGALGAAYVGALAGAVVIGATGAVTALGDTLFPANTLAEAVRSDMSATAHVLMRMRWFHPMMAISLGAYLVWLAGYTAEALPRARRAATFVIGAVVMQLAAGFVNMLLLAPIYMQVLHLLLADVLWIGLVVMAAQVWTTKQVAGEAPASSLEQGAGRGRERPAVARSAGALWRAYVAVTKPRIISLLLLTTLAAMVVAAGGWPGTWLVVAVAIGGYMAAGAANAINMVIDRDIDARMQRTSRRPTVTSELSSRSVLTFAAILATGSFALLWWSANLLSAALAMVGLLYYVFVYTLWLKRRTWHNIVIGGAAGAIPPLVGWAAVTGELQPMAWLLFAIIFAWTPVHFWALALLMKDDYASAGVPMLPVVRGEHATVVQIGLYALITAAVTVLPFLQREVGAGYLAVAVVLNGMLLARSARLYRSPDRQAARALFKFSLAYLALLFLALAVDRSTGVNHALAAATSFLRTS